MDALIRWGSKSDVRMWLVIVGVWLCGVINLATGLAVALFLIGVL